MITQGRITNVYFERAGSGLYEETPAGTTQIKVDSNQDFNEDGGECLIGDSTYSYTVGPEGLDYGLLTISPGLLIDGLEGEAVNTLPVSNVLRASVREDDNQSVSEDLDCDVAYSVAITLMPGERDEGEGEFVTVSDESGTLTVTEIHGQTPTVAAEYLGGVNPDDPLSDGDAPTQAPVITGRSFGIGAIQLTWPRITNHDPVTYRVYGSPTSPVPVDVNHYLGYTVNDSFVAARLPGDARIPSDVDSFYVVVPEDVDGVGPKSNEVAVRSRLADNETISSEYAYLGQVEATQLNAGAIFSNFAESDVFSTGPLNPQVNISAAGIYATDPNGDPRFVLPTDPNLPAEFRGVFRADSLTVYDRLSIRGQNNEFLQGTEIQLSNALGTPKEKPSLAIEYPENSVDADPAWTEGGMKRFSDGKWYSYLNAWGTWQLKQRTMDANGNLGPATVVIVHTPNSGYGGTQTVHDILEWRGKIMVLVHDGDVDPNWSARNLSLRQFHLTTFAPEYSHTLTVALSDKKAALSASSSSTVIAVGRTDAEQGGKWNIRGYEIDLAPPGPVVVPIFFNHTLDAGRAEDMDTLQYAPTSAVNSAGSGNRWYIKSRGSACLFAFDPATRTRSLNDEANMTPIGSGAIGSVWFDGTRWHAWQQTRIYHLSTFRWAGTYVSTKKVWARYSWYDSTTAGTGKHESLVSPPQAILLPKLAYFRVTTQQLPPLNTVNPDDSVTGVRIWLKYDSASEPALSAYGRAAADLADGVISVRYGDSLDVSVTPPNSGSTPAFPKSAPAVLFSEATDSGGNIIRVAGDGSGRMGPYKWTPDGKTETPAISCMKTSTQTIASADGTTLVVMNELRGAPQGGMQLQSGTIIVPRAGWYDVSGCVTFASSTSGARRIAFIGVGGVAGSLSSYVMATTYSFAQSPAAFTTLHVSAKVYALANQSIGIAANVATNWGLDVSQSYMCNLQAVWVG